MRLVKTHHVTENWGISGNLQMRVAKSWRIIKTITSISLYYSMLGYLSLLSVPRSSQFSIALGADNVRGQISKYIFAPNRDYCLYIHQRRTYRLRSVQRTIKLKSRNQVIVNESNSLKWVDYGGVKFSRVRLELVLLTSLSNFFKIN